MYNVIKGEQSADARRTLAEGIQSNHPAGHHRDHPPSPRCIVLVTEDEIERAVAMLIAIEKTVVEARAWLALPRCWRRWSVLRAAMSACSDRRQYRHAADRLGADPRTRTRGPADADRHRHRRPAGPAGRGLGALAEAGANIIEVSHQRTFSDLPARHCSRS